MLAHVTTIYMNQHSVGILCSWLNRYQIKWKFLIRCDHGTKNCRLATCKCLELIYALFGNKDSIVRKIALNAAHTMSPAFQCPLRLTQVVDDENHSPRIWMHAGCRVYGVSQIIKQFRKIFFFSRLNVDVSSSLAHLITSLHPRSHCAHRNVCIGATGLCLQDRL